MSLYTGQFLDRDVAKEKRVCYNDINFRKL